MKFLQFLNDLNIEGQSTFCYLNLNLLLYSLRMEELNKAIKFYLIAFANN